MSTNEKYPDSPKKPEITTDKFLHIRVHENSTPLEIIAAIATALDTADVPFFRDRKATSRSVAPPPPSLSSEHREMQQQQAETKGAPASNTSDGAKIGDALLLYVQTEGW